MDEKEEWVLVRRPAEKDLWNPSGGSADHSDPLKIVFKDPASYWTDALPIGNGPFGAMIWGRVDKETLNLNEDTLWTGVPGNYTNPNSLKVLAQVRRLVDERQYAEATALASAELQGKSTQIYQQLGDLELKFDASHSSHYNKKTYWRELDLDTATVKVKYSVGNVEFTREHFASHPDQVIVTRITSSKPGSVTFTASFVSDLHHNTYLSGQNQIIMEGCCRGDRSQSKISTEEENDCSSPQGIKFTSVLDVQAGGSSAVLRSLSNNKLRVENCDWVVLILAASSNFDGPFTNPADSTKDPTSLVMNKLSKVKDVSYSDLYARHLDDYQTLFHRVSIRLSKANDSRSSIKVAACKATETDSIPTTAERVKSFQRDEDPSMIELLYQYGRYLLITSSRPGSQPSNLQGIWSRGLHPSWDCAPHVNINLPMNYWPCLPCNLKETQEPLFDITQTLSINGSKTAKVNYDANGWVTHSITDLWGKSDPDCGSAEWAQWPMGGAWLATHLWEHYCYTMDEDFLEILAYPLIKGSALFLLDWLIPGPDGYLQTNPSTSPEHAFITSSGKNANVSYSSTMDMSIIKEIFSIILTASEILGKTEDEVVEKVIEAQTHLPPVKIARDGTVMEWAVNFRDTDLQHRHISHLFGIYPGHSITPEKNPELCKAAENTLILRGEDGPGWSTVWKTNVWARIRNSEHTYRMIKHMFVLIKRYRNDKFEGGLYGNLFSAHPPFQIDANFGFSAAVSEVLVQSTVRDLFLLPALPKDKWPSGCVKGLKARGGLTVNISWQEGEIDEVGLWSSVEGSNSTRRLHYEGKSVTTKILPGHVFCFNRKLEFVRKYSLP